jgi:chemotaxis protein MotA
MEDARALAFLTDTLELITSGSAISAHDFEALLDLDIEARHEHDLMPSRVLSTMADAFPGIGIVAAVLGIIITMNHMDGPAVEIGRHVAAALVGTLLGVLISYGFFQGLATNLGNKAAARRTYLVAQKQVLVAIQRGAPPSIAVELARRSLPDDVRPTSRELFEACRARS